MTEGCRRFIVFVFAGCCVVAATAGVTGISGQRSLQQAPSQPSTSARGIRPAAPETYSTRTSKAQLERWMTELSNWGRWGKQDQLGTVNLITPEKRQQAARLVKTGVVVSLASETLPSSIDQIARAPGPTFVGPPTGSSMAVNFGADGLASWVHELNYALTSTHRGPHLDALCHVAYNDTIYNGYSLTDIASTDGGCSRMGIAGVKDKVVTRAILVDIARMKGLQTLPPGTRIYREDIEAFEKWAKVKFEPGDVFLYRLGSSKGSGLDPSFLPFLKQRDIALFGGDTAHEMAITVPGFALPTHVVGMVALGMNFFDNLDLEAVAETAARLKRWEFMFVAAPTPSTRGTGSQINPLAVF